MYFKKGITALIFSAIAHIAFAQDIVIDTFEDLQNTPGWIVTCDRGYQNNLSDFECHNRLKIGIPEEELHGEVGFWAGCQSDCTLTYLLRATDELVRIKAYLNGMHLVVIRNDVVFEEIQGDKWIDIQVDLPFTNRIGIKLGTITQDTFAVLDRVTIVSTPPTTTTEATTTQATTTVESTTTASTTQTPPTTTPSTTQTPPTTTPSTTQTPPTTTPSTTQTPPTTTPSTTQTPPTTTPSTTQTPPTTTPSTTQTPPTTTT